MFTYSVIQEWLGRVLWYAIWRHYANGLYSSVCLLWQCQVDRSSEKLTSAPMAMDVLLNITHNCHEEEFCRILQTIFVQIVAVPFLSERFSCTCFDRGVVRWSRGFSCTLFVYQERPRNRSAESTHAPPFLASFGEFPWFHCVGGMHLGVVHVRGSKSNYGTCTQAWSGATCFALNHVQLNLSIFLLILLRNGHHNTLQIIIWTKKKRKEMATEE